MKLRKLLEDEQRDVISVTIPMLIKLLEWARETADSDVQIHELIEKLANRPGPLGTEVYDELVGDAPEPDQTDTMADPDERSE
jgi:mannose/fructose-specific phosphotransferase system component IIA